jgi:hypothetical protein
MYGYHTKNATALLKKIDLLKEQLDLELQHKSKQETVSVPTTITRPNERILPERINQLMSMTSEEFLTVHPDFVSPLDGHQTIGLSDVSDQGREYIDLEKIVIEDDIKRRRRTLISPKKKKSKVTQHIKWAIPGDTTRLCRLLAGDRDPIGHFQLSEAKKRIAKLFLVAENNELTKVQKKQLMQRKKSTVKIIDTVLKVLRLMIRRTRYDSDKPAQAQAFGSIVHWLSHLLVTSVCRGPMDAIDSVKRLSYDCERSAVTGLAPIHLEKIFSGVNRYLTRDLKIVAIFGTLGRAMPAMQDVKRQRNALTRTVIGMTSHCPPLAEAVETELRTHVRKLVKHTNKHNTALKTGMGSLNACYENSKAHGGQYAFIKEEVRTGEPSWVSTQPKYSTEVLDKSSWLRSNSVLPSSRMEVSGIESPTFQERFLPSQLRQGKQYSGKSSGAFAPATQTPLQQQAAAVSDPRLRPRPAGPGIIPIKELNANTTGRWVDNKYIQDENIPGIPHKPIRKINYGLEDNYVEFVRVAAPSQEEVQQNTVREPIDRWDDACKRLYFKSNANAIPKVNLSVIPETGARFRVAGAGQAGLVALLKPLANQVSAMLKSYGPLKAIFRGDSAKVIKRLNKAPFRQDIISTDMSQATDLINQRASTIVIEELSSKLNWTDLQTQIALESVGPVALDYKGETLGISRRGTQLGFPLSFCILCILNAFALKGLSKKNRQSSSLFGDDSIITAPDNEWCNYVGRLESLGMKVNLNKTHKSKIGAIFCGTIYRRFGKVFNILTTVKLSNMFPNGHKTWNEKLDAGIKTVEGFMPKVLKKRIDFEVNDDYDIPREIRNHILQEDVDPIRKRKRDQGKRSLKDRCTEAIKARSMILDALAKPLQPFKGKIYENLPKEYYGLGFPLLPGDKIPKKYRKLGTVIFASGDSAHQMSSMSHATCVWSTSSPQLRVREALQEVSAMAEAELKFGAGKYEFRTVVSKAIPIAIGDMLLSTDCDKNPLAWRLKPWNVAKTLSRRVKATTELWSAGKIMSQRKFKLYASRRLTVTDNSVVQFSGHYTERLETVKGFEVRKIFADLSGTKVPELGHYE